MLALIVGLTLLTWAASGVVQSTVREWFERDVQSRSQLVLIGARPALADAWYDSANLTNNWSRWRRKRMSSGWPHAVPTSAPAQLPRDFPRSSVVLP